MSVLQIFAVIIKKIMFSEYSPYNNLCLLVIHDFLNSIIFVKINKGL